MATYNIGGVDLINDTSGIRRADGKPWGNYYTPTWEDMGNSWGSVSQALKMGDYRPLGELAPYGKEIEALNDKIASTENYDTGFGAGKWVPGAILGLGSLGIASELGAGNWFGDLFGGDAPWGVNAAKEATGAGMDLPLVDDWSNWMTGGGNALSELSALPPPTNLQDLMTKLDSTPSGKSILNTLTGGSSDVAGATSILSKILGSGGGSDWASILGKLGAAGLGAVGSNQQAKSLQELAQKYSDYGAPSRARFEAGMQPGFDPMSIPGYAGALDTASKGLLARLSATGGNPFGNPGGLIEANKAIVSGTAMPAVNEYLRQNANVGFGNTMNAAIPLETGAVGQQGNMLNALGYGINAVTNPQPSLADLLAQLGRYGVKLNDGSGL